MGADMNAKSDPAKTGNALDALIPRHSFHPLVIQHVFDDFKTSNHHQVVLAYLDQ